MATQLHHILAGIAVWCAKQGEQHFIQNTFIGFNAAEVYAVSGSLAEGLAKN